MTLPLKISQAHSASCSKCGGTVSEVPGTNYLQCAHCQSLVFPRGTPLATDGITPTGRELESTCPCCSEPLHTGKIDEHTALYCQRCYGILIPNRSFGEVVSRRRSARGQVEPQEVRAIDPDEYKRSLECPACQERMETHPYYGPGNVVIDTCCGCEYVWLDHGELAKVARVSGRSVDQPAGTAPRLTTNARLVPVADREDSPLQTLFDTLF